MDFLDFFNKTDVNLTKFLKDNDMIFSNIQPSSSSLPIFNDNKLKPILNDILEKEEYFESYKILESERIDQVASKVYNNSEYWWMILYFNNISDPFEWPLSYQELNELAKILYDEYGIYASQQVYFNLLYEMNEEKRTIKIIKEKYFAEVIDEINNNIEE